MRMHKRQPWPRLFLSLVCALVVLLSVAPVRAADNGAVAAALRPMVEALTTGNLVIEGHSIGAPDFMQEFYVDRRFQPAWTDAKNVDDLIAAIERSPEDGLLPEDFHLADLQRLQASEPSSPQEIASRDILYTDALARLGRQLYFGKVNPRSLDTNWNLDAPVFKVQPAKLVNEAIANRTIPDLFASLRSPVNGYEELRAALAEEREKAKSDTPAVTVPGGSTLRKGDQGQRVAALRQRLGLPAGQAFDAELEAAVIAFQSAQGLDADGLVGAGTLAALNTGPAQRIDTLRVNLERGRWFRDIDQHDKFIAVNVAGFRVYLVENQETIWETRAIVGKPYRKTPLFTAEMDYLVLNPTWTPTRNIINNSILPKVKKDPGYLTANNYVVHDGSGRRVDPQNVNVSKLGSYRIVQQPGEKNALGQVKFIFPNSHAVYLHDTPSRNLFNETQRAFSAGCIRTENPLELAKLLLSDQADWQPGAVDATVASGETKTVYLSRPIPVYLLYWTANPLGEGSEVEFLPDVYERDRPLLQALNAPFKPID